MSPVAIIYIVTAIVSVGVALFLSHLAKISAQARTLIDEKRTYEYKALDGDEALRQIIFGEVKEIVDSSTQSREIVRKLEHIFSRELEIRLNLHSQELNKKYETIIGEKVKNEEVAWRKYKKVFSDKKKTEAVIRSIAEGLVVVDSEGKVIMMNPAAERLLGVSRKDKIGRSISEDMKEEQLISLVKGAGDREEKEIELISQRDETKKVLRASSAVIEDENGQTVGMVSVLSDITKQKELDKIKSNFVASVSHELRTPLVAIDKSLTLILSKSAGEISSTQEQFLSIAQRNLKRLSFLINDLLDLSKLEAGKMEIKRQASSIYKVVSESVDSLNNWAGTKSITIENKILENLPEINIDPDRIIQVLNNLIGNAIKFTPNGGRISVEANLNQGKGQLEVSVQDTGIGIAPEDLPRVFDKFYQAGERLTSDIGGTGIGLSITKEIVQLHGGKIWAESEKGRGAKFTFTLPLSIG